MAKDLDPQKLLYLHTFYNNLGIPIIL